MLLRHTAFQDRRDAGTQLAAALLHLKNEQVAVFALPRGGVPVAFEVATALQAPMDVVLVRKIGAPGYPELGLGAVVDGVEPTRVMNQELLTALQVSDAYLGSAVQAQLREIERRRLLYCGTRPALSANGRSTLVIDDGIATGSTMKVALKALKAAGAHPLRFAVPVAAADVLAALRNEADEGICLLTPENFRAVGLYYENFTQTSDEEVVELLHRAAIQEP